MVQRVYEEPEFSEVLERLPLDVRRSLTFEQRSAISVALKETRRKHAVDIRLVLPLLFTQLYMVLFIGRDLRRDTQDKMVDRRSNVGQWALASFVGVSVLVLAVVAIVLAYIGKSRAGIDLLPNSHGKDVIRGLGIR